jgi:hypothetical protein
MSRLPIRLGLIDCTKGSVQKRFDLKDGKAIKDGRHFQAVSEGTFNDVVVKGVRGFAGLLSSLNTNP